MNEYFTSLLSRKSWSTLQKQLTNVKLLIIDELGYVPFTAVGSELLFEVFSRRYEHGSTLVTSNLPFDEVDQCVGIRTIDRCAVGPLNPSCAYSWNEWRIVSPDRKQKTAKADSTNQVYRKGGCQTNIKDGYIRVNCWYLQMPKAACNISVGVKASLVSSKMRRQPR